MDDRLIEASKVGDLETVQYLIENGADVHADNYYAFRWAAYNGHLGVVRLLVSVGADIHSFDDYAFRSASCYGRLEMVKFLVSIGAKIHAKNDYAIRHASGNGHLETVKYLVSIGANVHNGGAIHCASCNGHLETVKFLVSCGSWYSELNPYEYLAELGGDHLSYFQGLEKYDDVVRVIKYRTAHKITGQTLCDVNMVCDC